MSTTVKAVQPRRLFSAAAMRICLLGLIGFALLPWTLLAEAAAPTAATTPLAPPIGYSVLRMLGALTIVIALLLALAWLARNWQRFAVPRGRISRLAVLEVKSLGARHALYVVGYENQRFLLSSAPAGISLLTNLPPVAPGDPELATPEPPPAFAQVLSRALRSVKGERSE